LFSQELYKYLTEFTWIPTKQASRDDGNVPEESSSLGGWLNPADFTLNEEWMVSNYS
jgi:hypothetical protein